MTSHAPERRFAQSSPDAACETIAPDPAVRATLAASSSAGCCRVRSTSLRISRKSRSRRRSAHRAYQGRLDDRPSRIRTRTNSRCCSVDQLEFAIDDTPVASRRLDTRRAWTPPARHEATPGRGAGTVELRALAPRSDASRRKCRIDYDRRRKRGHAHRWHEAPLLARTRSGHARRPRIRPQRRR